MLKFFNRFVNMSDKRKQIKILELTEAITLVINQLMNEVEEKKKISILDANNVYFTEIGVNLGLERYSSSTHNLTCSKLFAICDFFEISMSDFFIRVEKANELLVFKKERKGMLVKRAYNGAKE